MMSGHAYNPELISWHSRLQHPSSCHKAPSHSSARSMRMAYMVKDAWQCCTGPRSGYPRSTIYAKTCLVTLLPRIWKPSFGSCFSILSHWFNMPSSQNAEEAGPCIWRSPERDCIYFMQLATFIMQNRCIYAIWRCAPCRMDMVKDEFHSYTEEGFFTIQCSDMFWGGVWSDMTRERVLTHTKMVSGAPHPHPTLS